jgi:hypothetical protein
VAAVSKSGTPSLSTRNPCPGHYVGSDKLAGEAIAAGDPCYIKGSDSLVYKSVGTTTNAAAKVDGWAAGAAASGEAVSLLTDVELHYGSGLTPGARYYVSLTAGVIQDSASTGGTGAVAKAIDATRIRVWASTY